MRPVFASSRTMAFAMRSSASSENMRSISLRKGRERGCERGARIEEGGRTGAGIAAAAHFGGARPPFWRALAGLRVALAAVVMGGGVDYMGEAGRAMWRRGASVCVT